jgi:hypothetical protein
MFDLLGLVQNQLHIDGREIENHQRFGAQALFQSRLGICISAPEFSHQPSNSTFSLKIEQALLPS